jgi:hypothetical protein
MSSVSGFDDVLNILDEMRESSFFGKLSGPDELFR